MSIIKMSNLYRYYQQEADDAIYDELLVHNKCIVKMFCGTGKSLLMRNCKIIKNQPLVVYVVPSLSLIDQFYTDYFTSKDVVLKVSSEADSTTDKKEIVNFLKKKKQKIVCVTYASYNTLLQALGDTKINVCIFDEAHHAVGESYQSLIFENDACEKQIFFTATPKNANGIVMYDKDAPDSGVCGKLVYDYSYFKGVMEQYLNPFEIRVDFYTENTNNSVYESIARAIFASGNSRCLTFHADVNGERDHSVTQFVNQEVFIRAFNHVLEEEFPEKAGYYTTVKMIALSANINVKDRKNILAQFDVTPDNEVCIISSCQTIGEGVDTKNANMCVFVDPKSSYVSITQNIGRIVRKNPNIAKPNSTILIPCWVDKEKYLGCNGDRDKCDEVIRQDMNKEGNFNGILNVMSALKQEDEDLFDACLHYPDTYSPQEIEGNLAKYGYKLEEPVSLLESLEHVLDAEVNIYEDEDETEEEMLTRVAEENDVIIEVHTNSLETPIEYYGEDQNEGGDEDQNDTEVVRIFKSYDEELEENVYQPIVKKDGPRRNTDKVEPLRRDNRFNVKMRTNPDVKILLSLSNEGELSRGISSCIIDCQVVDIWSQRLEELKKFIDENKRRPNSKTTNPEKRLNKWLSHQQQNYTNKMHSMKHRTRYNLWSQFLEDYKEYFVRNVDIWSQKFEELKIFINVNKKRPSAASKTPEEKHLGCWLSSQTNNYKNKTDGMKDEMRYNLWSTFLEDYKEYFVSDDEIWFQHLDELKMFIDTNKRKPTNHTNTQEEKYLGKWLSHQLKNYKKKTEGMKDEMRYNLWTQFLKDYKEYFISKNDLWLQMFEELKTFIATNKRRPSAISKNPEEAHIGRWVCFNQTTYKNKTKGMKDNERYELWTQFLEEYKEYFVSGEEIWFQSFEELKLFIVTNKRRPTAMSKNPEEAQIGRWVHFNQINYKKKTEGMKDKERYELWTQFLEEYKEYFVSEEELWFQNFEELKLFMDANKQRPTAISKNPDEAHLGRWLSTQLRNYKNKTDGMKDKERYELWTQFLEVHNEHFTSEDEVWFQNFEELNLFIRVNKTTPSLTSKNPKENNLCRWVYSQKNNYKQKKYCMKDEVRYNLWTQFMEDYKEYFISIDEIWFQSFEELKIFMNVNKLKPSTRSKNKEDAKLGRWFNTQINDYKKKARGMKDETRYALWSQFLEDYAEYFNKPQRANKNKSTEEEEVIKIKPMQKKSAKLTLTSSKEEKVETDETIRNRTTPVITQYHNKFCKMRSDNLAQHFKENPEDFVDYHRVRDENFKTYEPQDLPCNRVIAELEKIKTKRTQQVVDMGCGTAPISKHFKGDGRFQFINYDHVAIDDTIQVCDISQMPLENDSVEICIMSLALWGPNCVDYIREAHRVLETHGKLYIIDSTKRWTEKDEQGNMVETKLGKQLMEELEQVGFTISSQNIDRFCSFQCYKA